MRRISKLLTFLLLATNCVALQANELLPLNSSEAEFRQHVTDSQWLVVKIWRSNCHICNREAHNYVDFYEFGADDNTTIVGVSLDSDNTDAARGFIEKHSVSYPNFITNFESGSQWYKELTGETFWGTPGFLIFDPDGKLRAHQIGAIPVETIEKFIAQNSL